jgi:hypothetical protein
MSQKVEFEFTASDKGLASQLLRMERGIERVTQKMMGLEGRLNGGAQQMQKMGGGNFLSAPIRQLAGITAGALSAQAVLAKMLSTGKEFSEEGFNAAKKWDQLFREFAGQSGLRGNALGVAEKRIRMVGQEVGLDIENTANAATQLVSSGFSAQEASGESLRQMLRGFVGSNLAGRQVEMRDLAQSTANFLSAQGLEKNAKNTEDLMSRVQSLYKTTNLQFQDFSEFARESASMKGIVSISEQLASLATLRDVMSADEASTGMRNLVGRLRTAGGTPEKMEGLKMLGLRKDEVDMVGEDFMTAITRLKDGINRTAPELRPIALKKIFEERGVAFAEILGNNLDLINERIKSQIEGKTQFGADVKFAAEGVNAASRRQENERLAFMAKSGADRNEMLFTEARQFLYEKGHSTVRTEANLLLARFTHYLGMNADRAVGNAVDMQPQGLKIVQQRLAEKLNPTGKPISKIESDLLAPNPERKFSPDQIAIWEQSRREFRNPAATFRNTMFNPWYDRRNRYPQEDAAIRQAQGIEREISGQIDAFGSLLPHQAEGMRGAVNSLQGLAGGLGNNVHTYDLQRLLQDLTAALRENSALTKANSAVTANTGEAAPSASQVHRPTTIDQQRAPVGGL